MRKPLLFVASVVFISGAVASHVSAADGDWKLPGLNPFASQGKPPTASRAGNAPTSGWHMPKVWPKTAPAKRTNQPNSWNKMTSGTQSFFTKTADALTPWDNKPTKQPPPKLTGSNSIFTQSGATKRDSKASTVAPASWWSSDTKDQKPKSVNDFLSQPRPH